MAKKVQGRKYKTPEPLPSPESRITDELSADMPHGWGVHERVIEQRGHNGQMMVVERGFVMSRVVNGIRDFSGTTGMWHGRPELVDCLFKTITDVEMVAAARASAKPPPTQKVATVAVTVPICVEGRGYPTRQINVRLTMEQSLTFNRILEGHRSANTEHNGKPIVTVPDVVRWFADTAQQEAYRPPEKNPSDIKDIKQ